MSQYSATGKEWDVIRDRILERDNYTCVYDGKEATTVDHIIPRVKGGTDEDSNLVAACKSCNSSKQDRLNKRMQWFDARWIQSIP